MFCGRSMLRNKVYNNDDLPELIETNLSPMGRRMLVAQLGEVSTDRFQASSNTPQTATPTGILIRISLRPLAFEVNILQL